MITFENVSKIYTCRNMPDKKALDGISFSLPEKGLVFLTGKSGSGKTTILNLLGGIDSVTEGQIKFNGKNLEKLNNKELNYYRANYIGFIFQEFFLLDNQSVKDNIMVTEQILHKKYTDETINNTLTYVGLEGYGKKKCSLLSSGEKQRVSIARALIKDSKILLADEPTGSLDSENGEKIFNLLKTISKNRLVVIVSHDLEAADKYADKIIKIKDGRIIEQTGLLENTYVEKAANAEFELQKSYGLTIYDIFRTALGNIKKTIFRTIICFLICAIGFSIFFVANVMATVDGSSRLLAALHENNTENGQIHLKSEDNLSKQMLAKSDVNNIIAKNQDILFMKIGTDYGGLFGGHCRGVAEIPQIQISEQQFVYGNAPQTHQEFFVTELYAEMLFEELSWKPEIIDKSSLIGHKEILYNRTFELTGIIADSKLQNYYVYFNEGFFDSISDLYQKDNIDGYCSYLYFVLGDNDKANYMFLKEYHGDNLYHKTNTKYYILTAISDNFYSTMATYLAMTNWFYGISMLFMLFIILICFNIISVSIQKNQKENGIKRALGCSNFDLFKVYLLQTAMPFVILIPLVAIFGKIIINKLNELLLSKLAVSFGLFSIGIGNVILLIVLCVGIITIGTIIPMIKLFKSQPIDVIKCN